ncbi:hypothetical protein [Dyella ginsengisoli]|uniref:hypothetical protein n=1 Tax=Dyella ginsengisoli TaxID=363848 RepID=UPI00034C53D8|nr:hypothetical protein [Dyella ginsengisoli]
MPLGLLYLGLLLAGVASFLLHYVALGRLASRLRQQHPDKWKIIAQDERGLAVSPPMRWMRLQNALRSPVMPALEDPVLNRWRRLWRILPLLAWAFLIAAFALRWITR